MTDYNSNKRINELDTGVVTDETKFVIANNGKALYQTRENLGLISDAQLAEALMPYISAEEVDVLLSSYPTDTELTAILLNYYTQSQVDALLSGKANTVHTHTASQVTDFNTAVSANSDVSANTTARHTHSNKALLDTYTQTEANLALAVAHKDLTNNPHSVTKSQVGLGNVDNTSDANKPVSTATQTALNLKVDKVTGYGLSQNDFTNTLKTKLDGIEDGAEVNTINAGDNITELVNDAGYATKEIQAPAFAYTTITGSISSISTSVHDCIIAGSGTLFTTEFDVGDIIVHPTQDSLAVTITRIVSNTDMRGIGFVLSGYVGTGFRRLKRITAVEDQAGTHIESLNAGAFNYFTGERNLPTKLIRGDVLFQNIFNSQSGIYLRSSASDGRMRIGHVNSVSHIQFQGGNASIVLSGVILESTTWSTPLYIGFENFGGGQVGLYVNKTGNGANQKVFLQTQRYAQNDDHPLLEVSANGIDIGRRNGSFWLEGIDDITLSMGKTSGRWKFGSFGTTTPTEATSRVHIVETNGYEQFRLETPYTPTSTADTNGEIGQVVWDNDYVHIKTSTGWKKTPITTTGGGGGMTQGQVLARTLGA